MAVDEGKIQDCRVRIGGDPDQPGELVPRGFLSALGTPDSTFYVITDESSGRLELANWIVCAENPLTARVAVNRVWMHLFGRGLVESTDDFGRRGDSPSHPELLDYLARRFVREGWSMKKLIRSLMLSSAYQMSSATPSSPPAQDPENKLLWRMNRRQLEPEVWRDALLFLSRQLEGTPGGSWLTNGPTANPLQAARRVQMSSLRRSLYLPVIRDATPDILRPFDPSNTTGTSLMPVTTTASEAPARSRAQASFLADCASAWAELLTQERAMDQAQRIKLAFLQALGRPPTGSETAEALTILKAPAGKTDDVPLQDAVTPWQAFCQRLLRSDAFCWLE